MRKRVVIGIFIVITLIIIFGINQNKTTFSSSKWINCKDKSTRINMITDLEKKHEIIGMNHLQVLELLGKPEWIFDSKQSVYEDFKDIGANEYWSYRIKDDVLAGWKIYLVGFKDNKAIGKKITIEDW